MLLSSSKSYLDSTSETNNNNNNNNSDNNDKDDSSDSNNSNSDDNSADPVIEEHGGEDVETNVQVLSQMQGVREQLRTAEALQLRWNDIQTLIRRTKVLDDFITYPNMNYYNSVTHNENYNNSSQSPTKHNNNNNNNSNNNSNEYVVVVSKIQELKHKMEVFTGQAVFLRNVATGSRYGSLEAAFSTQAVGELSDSNEESSYEGEITKSSNLHTFNTSSLAKNEASALITERATLSLFAQGLPLEVWKLLFTLTHQLYEAQEKFIQSHSGAEPELEC